MQQNKNQQLDAKFRKFIKVLIMAFVNENVVYTHLLEINDAVLVLLHLILERFKFGGQVLLALDKTFEHTA